MARRTAQEPASNRSHRPAGPAKSRPPGRGPARPKSSDEDTTSHRGTKSGQDRNASRPRRGEVSDRDPKSRHGGGGLDRRLKPRHPGKPEFAPKPRPSAKTERAG